MTAHKNILARAGFVYLVMVGLFLLVFAKIVAIQYFDNIECKEHIVPDTTCTFCQHSGKNQWRELGKTGVIYVDSIEAARGNIYDTNGKLLASSIPEYDIRFDIGTEYLKASRNVEVRKVINGKEKKIIVGDSVPRFERHIDTMAMVMAKVMPGKTQKAYRNILQKEWKKRLRAEDNGKFKSGSPWFVFGKKEFPVSYLQLENDIKKASIYRQKNYESGLISKVRYTRLKPYHNLATSLIGSIFDENKQDGGQAGRGRSGIELRYENVLHGKNGFKTTVDGLTRTVEPVVGQDITLTLDVNLQHFAEQSLLKQLQTVGAEEGCVVLMEVKTGKIRAISNLTKTKNGTYSDRTNIAFNNMRAPGSVFKVMSMMIALEDGAIQPDDEINTGNGIRLFPWTKTRNRKMEDTSAHGVITASQVIEMSSNIGIAEIINSRYKSNPQEFLDKIQATGFTKKLDFGIPAQSLRINGKDDTGAGPTYLPWLAMGYECLVPPIYTLMFYNALANNGVMMKPYFVEKIGEESIAPEIINDSICSQSTLRKLIPMMETVVQGKHGTARIAKSSLFNIAGKTGTSTTNERGSRIYQASFCGFFPVDNPQYSMIAVLWKHNGRLYGGGGGGPVFKEIAEKAFLLNERKHPALLTDTRFQPAIKRGNTKHLQTVFAELNLPADGNLEEISPKDTISVVGMGLRDAIYFLEKAGFSVFLNNNNNVGTVREVRRSTGKNVELVLN
jgi:cell division protein FtsI (penicillin-binding protein 3)